ncbi:hypothetical protein DFH07DRAFT_1056631 [Mycena maculata]|uniref:Uncharacterized protein n=1 Tax=Mycena maculata TaxID=230809 RepID=A0AAD7K1V0_9AGAR|nr:hypothetical protein DFH07DRAFT_1056631 [Mycena maculata]
MYFAAALANLTNIITFLIGGPLLPRSLAIFASSYAPNLLPYWMFSHLQHLRHDDVSAHAQPPPTLAYCEPKYRLGCSISMSGSFTPLETAKTSIYLREK